MRAIEPDNLCGDTMQLTPALRKKSYNVKEPPVLEHRTVRQEMLIQPTTPTEIVYHLSYFTATGKRGTFFML